MKITLRIWRQPSPEADGRMVNYHLDDVSPDRSFLEMLDVLNERLILDREDPVSFDHDCREGICGSCGVVVNGQAHGPIQTTVASCICARSTTATRLTSSRGGRVHSQS